MRHLEFGAPEDCSDIDKRIAENLWFGDLTSEISSGCPRTPGDLGSPGRK